MCVMNTNTEPKTIDLNRFMERIKGFQTAVDVAAGVEFRLEKNLQLMPVSNLVLELK